MVLYCVTWYVLTVTIGYVFAECNEPLGMENGKIKDDQISASNWLHYQTKSEHFGASLSRLNMKSASGSWCSEDITKYKNRYIQIDLLQNKKIKSFATQGRDNGSFGAEEYTEHVRITYQRDGEEEFRKYNESGEWKLFDGNRDNINIIYHTLKHSIVARKIRIHTYGEEFAIHCLRLELYGCHWQHLSSGLTSYESPRGGVRRGVDLTDNSYDGVYNKNENNMENGLGQLADDIYGKKSLITNNGSPWVGFNTENPELRFSFTEKKLIKQVLIHVNNNGDDIRLFSKVDIYISADNVEYTFLRSYTPTSEEQKHKDAFAIIIELGSEVLTKHIKLVFGKSTDTWLLLSEVLFISDTYPPNVDGTLLPTRRKPGVRVFTERPVSRYNEKENEKESTASLSFPIILTIALVTFVLAVVVGIFIYKSYKKKRKHDREPQPIIPTQSTTPQSQQYMPSLNKQALLYEEQLLAMQQQQQQQQQQQLQHNMLLANGMYIQQPYNSKVVMS